MNLSSFVDLTLDKSIKSCVANSLILQQHVRSDVRFHDAFGAVLIFKMGLLQIIIDFTYCSFMYFHNKCNCQFHQKG